MNLNLVRKLIEVGVIRQQTELEATYMGVDIAGVRSAKVTQTFAIRGVSLNEAKQTVTFQCVSTVDGSPRTIKNEQVLKIDGMTLEHLAANYNFDIDGNAVPEPTRRGRKPGAKKAKEAAAAKEALVGG